MKIYADRARHVVTVPLSRDNLLKAADALGIPRHWYHPSHRHLHLDVPTRLIGRVLRDPLVTVVSPREVARMARRAL